MGQTRTVMVHRLLGDETVDESILQMLETKQARFDAFADISEAAKAQEELELSKENQKEIIDREVERFTAAETQTTDETDETDDLQEDVVDEVEGGEFEADPEHTDVVGDGADEADAEEKSEDDLKDNSLQAPVSTDDTAQEEPAAVDESVESEEPTASGNETPDASSKEDEEDEE